MATVWSGARGVLFGALCALRDAPEPFAAENGAHWRAVDRWLRTMHRGRDRDDVHQETLIAVAGAVRTMAATSPGSAAAWLRCIFDRKRIDRDRRTTRARIASHDARPIEAFPAPDVWPEFPAEWVIAALERDIARHLWRTCPDVRTRELRQLQARAALRRLVLGEDLSDLSRALVLEGTTAACVYKWTERGRSVVLDALEGGREDELTEARALVCEAMRARRADAGVARPERRAA